MTGLTVISILALVSLGSQVIFFMTGDARRLFGCFFKGRRLVAFAAGGCGMLSLQLMFFRFMMVAYLRSQGLPCLAFIPYEMAARTVLAVFALVSFRGLVIFLVTGVAHGFATGLL